MLLFRDAGGCTKDVKVEVEVEVETKMNIVGL
jgi:hypothetical protein